MPKKTLSYSYSQVLRLVLADCSKRTGVPVDELNGSVGEHGAWVERKDEIDLVELTIDKPLLDEEIEPLRIHTQGRTRYEGEWVQPARVTSSLVKEVLDRISSAPRARNMYELLVTHNNQPRAHINSDARNGINKALAKPIGGKYYRLAGGTNRAGDYRSQLWEVEPASAEVVPIARVVTSEGGRE